MNRTVSLSHCILYIPSGAWYLQCRSELRVFVDFRRVHNENQDFYKVCEAGQGSGRASDQGRCLAISVAFRSYRSCPCFLLTPLPKRQNFQACFVVCVCVRILFVWALVELLVAGCLMFWCVSIVAASSALRRVADKSAIFSGWDFLACLSFYYLLVVQKVCAKNWYCVKSISSDFWYLPNLMSCRDRFVETSRHFSFALDFAIKSGKPWLMADS